MNPYKENEIRRDLPFPVDIFIRDNLKNHVVVEPHWHDCIEILYMLEGNARQYVNDKHFEVQKEDIVILHEGDIHCTYCAPGEDVRILVVKFLPDVISGSYAKLFESRYILPFLQHSSPKIHHIRDISGYSPRFRNVLLGLYEEYMTKEPGYEIYIKGYIYQLIACLNRYNVVPVNSRAGSEDELQRMDKLFKYIEAHYSEKLDLTKAASLLNLSCAYFARQFRKVTGRTFKEYVDFVRICEVEKLILTQGMNISQAAYEAGFGNISSFNRVFRRVRGYAPGEIKRSKTAKD
jgi:AraC-like DNA-binding protein